MTEIKLSEVFLADIAGWSVVQEARSLFACGKVLSASWTPPVLKGVVQDGSTSYRAGLVINNRKDVDNLCQCRKSRQWGTICAHSVAVGLRKVREQEPPPSPSATTPSTSRNREKPSQPAASPDRSKERRLPRAAEAEGGRPLSLVLTFPPNLPQALEKRKVMLYIEAKTEGRKCPLDQIPRSTSYTLSEHEDRLLETIETLAGGEPPSMLMLQPSDLCRLLPHLIDHANLNVGKSGSVNVTNTPWSPPLKATLEPNGEITVAMKSAAKLPLFLHGESPWVFQNETFHPFGLPTRLTGIFEQAVRIPRHEVPPFLNQEWPKLVGQTEVEANFQLDDFTLRTDPPRIRLHLAGGLAQLQARLQAVYRSQVFDIGPLGNGSTPWIPDPENPTVYLTRDPQSEHTALQRLRRAGFSSPDDHGTCQMTGQETVFDFFARLYPKLLEEWEVTMEERLEKSTAKNLERIEPQFQVVSSGERWFDLDVSYQTSDGERLSQSEIQKLLLSKRNHTRLSNGKIALIDTGAVEEVQETLKDCAPQQHSTGYRLSNAQAGFLQATLQQQGGWSVQGPKAWQERVAQQQGTASLEPPPLGELESVLRPYQKKGVGWLHFLRQNGFGGILADEMGLGKTLQTLAFLESVKEHRDRTESPLPSLIVCPTSLVFNWLAEAKHFTPQLRVLALYGPKRQPFFKKIAEHDIVITSYALIRRDAKRYKEHEFDTVVLDEAQHIKNRQTQNAQAVKAIASHHRLVLTGTPLENSVLDLWSIFDFLMPGYLGAAKDFQERYEIPITKHKDRQAQDRLARRLRPFLLRRTKQEVERDLPDKIEQVSYCDLTQEQASIYKEVLEATRKEVYQAARAQSSGKTRMIALNALLRLRQICCDLRLLKLEQDDSIQKAPSQPSGKLELFTELLEEIIDGGHRVLVFSQFVSMLKILQEHLDRQKLRYCYLDGSTTDRGNVVNQFQNDADIPAFLISLKAGGVGLNLSGADTVIHFDPWWNPAVEQQATDRAHRIGQTRVVTQYKLITRNTVEEKILNLQNRKRELIDGTLGEENQLLESLSWDEIQELLE